MSNPEEALFDSWQQGRKQGMSAGIRYEKERIIKLLQEHEDNWRCREGCCDGFGWDIDNPINQLTLLISLIKGEK